MYARRNEGHAFVQVTGGFNCEFLLVEVAPFLHAPEASSGQAVNGTTSTKEISTAKSSM